MLCLIGSANTTRFTRLLSRTVKEDTMGIEKNVLKHATLVDGSEQTSEATNDRQLSFDFEVRACKYASDVS